MFNLNPNTALEEMGGEKRGEERKEEQGLGQRRMVMEKTQELEGEEKRDREIEEENQEKGTPKRINCDFV